jgi:UDP-glucose 4-epimerase
LKKKVLIVGGFGYLGSSLAQYFLDTKYEISITSSKKRARPAWLGSGKIIKIDWKNPDSFLNACKHQNAVIYAAGMNAKDCNKNPKKAEYFNGVITSQFIQASLECNVKKFIYFSTAHVYSSNLNKKTTELTKTTNSSPYATSHLSGENAVLSFKNKGSIHPYILRLANVYGIPANLKSNCWHLLVNDLCRQAATIGEMIIKSKKNETRDFISLTEVCRFVAYLIENKLPKDFCLINLGSGETHNILDIAKIIQKRVLILYGKKINIKCSKEINSETKSNFKFRSNELKRIKYKVNDRKIDEIDKMLVFFESFFCK